MITLQDKKLARYSVLKAVKNGTLKKPNFCESCKIESKVDGHHKDYGNHLDVSWLCRKCHALWHKNFGYEPHIDDSGLSLIRFEVEPKLKANFMDYCKRIDSTVSQQLRRMIKSYLGENE